MYGQLEAQWGEQIISRGPVIYGRKTVTGKKTNCIATAKLKAVC